MTLRSEMLTALHGITALGQRNYDDEAPDKTALPYTTMMLDISEVPKLSGDGRCLATERLVQLDLWEARATETEALRNAIWTLLDGLSVPSASCRLRVRQCVRVHDPDYGIAHRAFTIAAIASRAA